MFLIYFPIDKHCKTKSELTKNFKNDVVDVTSTGWLDVILQVLTSFRIYKNASHLDLDDKNCQGWYFLPFLSPLQV